MISSNGWYYAHLISWVLIVAAIALHLLINAKVGGAPLLLSMVQWRYRAQDGSIRWSQQVAQWWGRYWPRPWLGWWQSRSGLNGLEAALLGTILTVWLIPIFKG